MKESKKNLYYKYLQSNEWFELRVKALKRDNYKCLLCKKDITESTSQIHHLHYNFLCAENELLSLASLCKECHCNHHKLELIDSVKYWKQHKVMKKIVRSKHKVRTVKVTLPNYMKGSTKITEDCPWS